jgi:hypothetical protein
MGRTPEEGLVYVFGIEWRWTAPDQDVGVEVDISRPYNGPVFDPGLRE